MGATSEGVATAKVAIGVKEGEVTLLLLLLLKGRQTAFVDVVAEKKRDGTLPKDCLLGKKKQEEERRSIDFCLLRESV